MLDSLVDFRLDLGSLSQCMWVSLDRISVCNRQTEFLLDTPDWFSIQIFIVSNLEPAETHRFLRSCLALLIEQKDLLLSGTALRLQYSASGFSVPTPPLQVFLQPAVGQGGGVWDNSVSSNESSVPASVANALEDEDLDAIQSDANGDW